ncbi:MAG: YutD family protein [Bacilli bacterium]|nr:YutD family protein [Bacilli bacterium]
MKKIVINNIEYEVIKDEKDAIDVELLTDKITDYYDGFDYIVGDYAYGKVRLKGFNDKTNKYFKPINDIKNLDEYINKSCAYGCKWFCIKKIVNKD